MGVTHYYGKKENIKKVLLIVAGILFSSSVLSCAGKNTSSADAKYDPFAPPPRQFGGNRKNVSTPDRLERLEKDNEALKRIIKESNARLSKLWSLMEELELKQQNLLGDVDTLRRQNEEILPILENKIAKHDGELLVIRSQLGIDEGVNISEVKNVDAAMLKKKESEAAVPKQTEVALYNASLDLFKKRRYNDAVDSFRALISAYPQSKYVPNAHFWMGESRYQAGDYTAAALAYEDVIKKYPKSSKIAASYLKQGMAFVKLKNLPVARIRLNHVVQKFPNTQEAKRAEKELFLIKDSK
ncbi:MAG: tol-pal system protein YbgF [Desulfovibrionaceae bacterium]